MVLFEPRHDTLNMKVMLARQKEHLIADLVVFDANRALLLGTILSGFFDRKFFVELPFDAKHSIDFIILTFVLNSLKRFNIHAINRALFRILIRARLIIIYSIKFILPVYEIQIVLSSRVHFYRSILPAILFFRRVW